MFVKSMMSLIKIFQFEKNKQLGILETHQWIQTYAILLQRFSVRENFKSQSKIFLGKTWKHKIQSHTYGLIYMSIDA